MAGDGIMSRQVTIGVQVVESRQWLQEQYGIGTCLPNTHKIYGLCYSLCLACAPA